jgi:hypothetical protein
MRSSILRATGAFLAAGLLLGSASLSARVLVRLSPTYIELGAKPGTQSGDRIKYVNAGTEPLLVSVELSDFDVNENGNAVEQPPGASPASLVPYLRVAPAPGQAAHFRYRVDAPAAFEQLRAMVYFVSRPVAERRGGTSAIVVPRMGIPIYLENDRAEAASLVITRGSVRVEDDRLLFDLEIENRGRRNLRPSGAIQIDTEGGPRFFQFNEGRSPILPGHARQWTLHLGPFDAPPRSLRFRFERSPGREGEEVFPVTSGAPSPLPS